MTDVATTPALPGAPPGVNRWLASFSIALGSLISTIDSSIANVALPAQLISYLVPKLTYVIAHFRETQIGHIRAGQRATVVLDALPNCKLEAKVEALAPATAAHFSLLPADDASGNFVKVVQAGRSAEVDEETR